MNKLFVFLAFSLASFSAAAQLNPVSWNFTTNKIDDKTYEVHLKATLQPGWHIYSQEQPEDAIAIPTAFTLNKNPLILLEGKIRELGKMEIFRDEKLDIPANQYANAVDFVQTVKLKAKAKTNLTGNVEFQTCDDKKCLPPKTVNFTIPIQ